MPPDIDGCSGLDEPVECPELVLHAHTQRELYQGMPVMMPDSSLGFDINLDITPDFFRFSSERIGFRFDHYVFKGHAVIIDVI